MVSLQLLKFSSYLMYFRVNAKSPLGSRKGPRRLELKPVTLVHPCDPAHLVQKEPLPTNFPCLFCNHEKSVSVKLDKKAGIGELSCKICGQQFQTGINCKCYTELYIHCLPLLIPANDD